MTPATCSGRSARSAARSRAPGEWFFVERLGCDFTRCGVWLTAETSPVAGYCARRIPTPEGHRTNGSVLGQSSPGRGVMALGGQLLRARQLFLSERRAPQTPVAPQRLEFLGVLLCPLPKDLEAHSGRPRKAMLPPKGAWRETTRRCLSAIWLRENRCAAYPRPEGRRMRPKTVNSIRCKRCGLPHLRTSSSGINRR